MKNNYKDMFLESESGYMMPFAVESDEEVQVVLPYGEQPHPTQGGTFFHKGVDFAVSDRSLYAMATGLIIGIGEDPIHENYIVARYGKYDVTYGHVKESFFSYGDKIGAGQIIATSGKFLHMGVVFNGQPLDPQVFLTMVWSNIQQLAIMGINSTPVVDDLGEEVHTSFDKDKDEIMMLMLRWYPSYVNEINQGTYAPSQNTLSSLKKTFIQASDKNYFYETAPTVGNPLGLSKRGGKLAGKLQDIMMGDFLSYLAGKYGIFPTSWNDNEKKKFIRRHLQMA